MSVSDFDFKVPRLGVGAGPSDGSGRLCGMQVVSWESGDAQITDLPDCADPMLAHVVQAVNDKLCAHRDGDLLCPECSVEVLALAHRTVGTRLDHLTDTEQRRVWVRLALDEAESVAHPDESPEITQCRRVTQQWLDGAATEADVRKVRAYAAYAYAATAADAAYAAYAAAAAAANAGDAGDRPARAHALISRFEVLTGIRGVTPEPEVTAAAVTRMTTPA